MFPFKDVDMAAQLPNILRDVNSRASMFRQALPQHVLDAAKEGNMSYPEVCSRQANSIHHFMALSKLFDDSAKAEMQKLLDALPYRPWEHPSH